MEKEFPVSQERLKKIAKKYFGVIQAALTQHFPPDEIRQKMRQLSTYVPYPIFENPLFIKAALQRVKNIGINFPDNPNSKEFNIYTVVKYTLLGSLPFAALWFLTKNKAGEDSDNSDEI